MVPLIYGRVVQSQVPNVHYSKVLGDTMIKVIDKIGYYDIISVVIFFDYTYFFNLIGGLNTMKPEKHIIFNGEKFTRDERTGYYLIQCLLESITLKNPSAFIIQAIQRSKDFTYVPRVIEELKNDSNLYCFNNKKGV